MGTSRDGEACQDKFLSRSFLHSISFASARDSGLIWNARFSDNYFEVQCFNEAQSGNESRGLAGYVLGFFSHAVT